MVLIDHHDSFVHTLADYFRQTGAEVLTYRSGVPEALLDALRPDLLVLSPGPGRPQDFPLDRTLAYAQRRGIRVFGVCLGLQGLVQYLGGRLRLLDAPVHGKSSAVELVGGGGALLAGLPRRFRVGRYHSLHAETGALPRELKVTARTTEGVVMAVEHMSLPLAGVQFHPESIMTLRGRCGHLVVANAVSRLGARASGATSAAAAVPRRR